MHCTPLWHPASSPPHPPLPACSYRLSRKEAFRPLADLISESTLLDLITKEGLPAAAAAAAAAAAQSATVEAAALPAAAAAAAGEAGP